MAGPILIIEDDPDIAEALSYGLEKNDFKTRIALNGEEGLSASLDRFNPPSVILVDLLLPGMSGFELCRRLRSEALTRATPIVIVSARASEKEIATSAELGVDDYIVKPFSIREVVGRINSLLELKNKLRNPRGLTTINPADDDAGGIPEQNSLEQCRRRLFDYCDLIFVWFVEDSLNRAKTLFIKSGRRFFRRCEKGVAGLYVIDCEECLNFLFVVRPSRFRIKHDIVDGKNTLEHAISVDYGQAKHLLTPH